MIFNTSCPYYFEVNDVAHKWPLENGMLECTTIDCASSEHRDNNLGVTRNSKYTNFINCSDSVRNGSMEDHINLCLYLLSTTL